MFEKNGWTGDAAVGAEMFMMNLDVHELFAKWMRDLDETREANGAPLVIAPSSGDLGCLGSLPAVALGLRPDRPGGSTSTAATSA